MTHRALELLNLPDDESKFILDIGCGSGLSGEILDEQGHYWVGVDIAPSMLGNAYHSSGIHVLTLSERWLWKGRSKEISFSKT